MIKEVTLSKKEYDYLIHSLLKGHENLINKIKIFNSTDSIKLYLDEDRAQVIRDLGSVEVALHFDENYEPTEEGWILEHFIDKFYFE